MAVLSIIWLILKTWWWLLLPLILFFLLRYLYLWWIRWETWYPTHKWILLEIKPPKEILKPFRAMEDIFSILWGIIDTPNWRERWCEGELPLGGGLWFSFEIASIGGEIHFFMRIPEVFRNTAESTIYSHYPEAEISLVDDYTKNVPQDIPNKDWDLYGEDFFLLKEDPYPIKTYSQFFEPTGERITKEEKRIDPLDSLMEALTKLQSGEQVWIQIVTNPIVNQLIPWVTRGREIADKIARRPKPISKPMIQEAVEVIVTGKPAGVAPPEEKEIIPPEMKLTPGERKVLTAIEEKISKYGYQTWIRTIYLCKKDAPHFFGNYKIARTYFTHFLTADLNGIKFWGGTRTRIHYILRERRLYLRKRKIFRNYLDRFPPLWPRTMKGEPLFSFGWSKGKGTFILNIEELATIFHFPSKITVPTVPRVEAKRGGPPAGLPTE